MWPTKFLLFAYDKLTHRNIMKEYNKLKKTSNFDLQRIKQYQENKLKSILEYAVENVPFYRKTLKKYVSNLGKISPLSMLSELPILTKNMIKNNFDDLISDEYRNTKNIYFGYTGGSTGQPLKFGFNKEYKDVRLALIYYNFIWSGYKFGDSHAYLYGSLLDFKKDVSYRNKSQHFIMNSFIENAYHLNEKKLENFISQLKERNVKYLVGYASALFSLAKFITDRKIQIKDTIKLKSIISTASYLYDDHRKIVEEVFGCKVFDRYGCREVGNIAHECNQHAGLHINWQNVIVEIFDDKKTYTSYDNFYKRGILVITCLNNYGMPFIRYNLEDLGVFLDYRCECTNNSPLIKIEGGRICDQFYNINKEIISGHCFTRLVMSFMKINQIQFIQNSFTNFTVKIVKSTEDVQDEIDLIKYKIKELFGENTTIDFIFVNKIEKEASGKYRYTKSLLTDRLN